MDSADEPRIGLTPIKRVYSVVASALDRGAGRQPWAGDGRGAGTDAAHGRLDRQTWSSATIIPIIPRVCIRAFMTITPDWSAGYVLGRPRAVKRTTDNFC